MNIQDAPHGINLVVETGDTIYLGRFDNTNGFQALLHDVAVHPVEPGEDGEAYVKQCAKYGFAVDQRDVMLDVGQIRRVRLLGDVPKE